MSVSRRALLRSTGALIAPLLLSRALRGTGESAQLNVRDYGARGDGKGKDTSAIQAAIDAAGRSGGTVYLPPGKYVSGTLRLRDRITLRLAAGATLIASADDADFDPYEVLDYDSFADRETTDFRFALLQGRALKAVGIFGPGRIDGNRTGRGGPKPIALKQCRDIQIRDLTIDNAPNYNIGLLGCDNVDIVGVTIRNGYSDGIDPDCCRNVRIADCRIESRDDAIVAKASFALGVRGSTENVLVTVDGGSLEHVRVSGITMAGVRVPLFVRLGRRGRGQKVPAAGELKDISIAHIVATGATWPSSITGIAGHPISNISLEDIRIAGKGGGKAALLSRDVPEREKQYPDATMFRDLPAYGLYCRHVKGLRADQVDLKVEQPDARPAVVLEDVRETDLRAIEATPPADGGPVFWFRSVRDGK